MMTETYIYITEVENFSRPVRPCNPSKNLYWTVNLISTQTDYPLINTYVDADDEVMQFIRAESPIAT